MIRAWLNHVKSEQNENGKSNSSNALDVDRKENSHGIEKEQSLKRRNVPAAEEKRPNTFGEASQKSSANTKALYQSEVEWNLAKLFLEPA